MSNSSCPHEVQHARSPCPSPAQSLLKFISIHSVIPFKHLILCRPLLLLPSIFPGSFPTSQLFASGGQSIGVSASASVLPMNIQYWFPLGWTGWISLQSKGLSRVFSNTTVQQFKNINSSVLSFLNSPNLTAIHDYWKNHSLAKRTFVGKVVPLLFNKLSRLVTTFLPRSKCLNFMAAITISSDFGAPPK